jgi:hypothetical protein
MAVYLPPDLHEAVREIAFRERASLSYIMTLAAQMLVKSRRNKSPRTGG